MNFKKTISTRTIVACAFAVCAMLTYAFLPEILSVGWHFLHGDSIQFGAWVIPVPWRYWEIGSKDAIDLQQAERWSPREYPASDLIIRNLQLPLGAEFDLEKWKKGSIDASIESGYRFTSENTFELDDETSICITVTDINRPEMLRIHCVFPIHRLDIQYMGTKAHSQSLDLIIRNIRPTK